MTRRCHARGALAIDLECNIAWISTGFFRTYIRNVSDDQRPIAWIKEGGTPFSASEVAPPACIDWPAMLWPKCRRRCSIKKERVGMVPFLCSHNGELYGCMWSQEFK